MSECKKIKVDKDVCYVQFEDEKSVYSNMIGYTPRREQVIVDFGPEGHIIGIELVSTELKPCQRPSAKNDSFK